MNENMATARETRDDYAKRIADENAKLSEANGGQRAAALARCADLQAEIDALKLRGTACQETQQRVASDRDALGPEFRGINDQINEAQGEVVNAGGRLQAVRNARENRMAAYGPQIGRVLTEIERSRWNRKPIGPIGRYVKIRDQKWAPILESVFLTNLNGFIVTNEQDRAQLAKILRSCNWSVVHLIPPCER
jgi:chromosome segregation ATPase